MNSYLHHIKLGALAPAALVAFSMSAAAAFEVGDKIGLSISEIAKGLENSGYDIREIEVKTDRIEAEVTIEGEKLEIKIDPLTGLVTRIEDD